MFSNIPTPKKGFALRLDLPYKQFLESSLDIDSSDQGKDTIL